MIWLVYIRMNKFLPYTLILLHSHMLYVLSAVIATGKRQFWKMVCFSYLLKYIKYVFGRVNNVVPKKKKKSELKTRFEYYSLNAYTII